ncbi:hypothetical protein L1887_15296 [Cichorium endivia]|nr:hypothetical protein L1887_15296 [Cichorium endivia]
MMFFSSPIASRRWRRNREGNLGVDGRWRRPRFLQLTIYVVELGYGRLSRDSGASVGVGIRMLRGLGRESGIFKKTSSSGGGANPGAVVRRDGGGEGKKESIVVPTGSCGDGQECSKAGE